MRHILAYRVTYVIAALLIGAGVLFAYIRSAEVVVVTEEELETEPSPTRVEDIAEFEWEALGGDVYSARCASCHGEDGSGREGTYPPLEEHAVDLAQAEDGRAYLIVQLLYGVSGEIHVDGLRYDGLMPAYRDELDDREAAAVLNHILTAWGNRERLGESVELYLPSDIEEQRGRDLELTDVVEERPDL